jgi:small subunit ribosomal protein S16
MSRYGRKKKPFYRIVAADKRSQRDGAFLDIIGTYDPRTKEANIKKDIAEKWIKNGAQLSDTVKDLFVKQGVSLATK